MSLVKFALEEVASAKPLRQVVMARGDKRGIRHHGDTVNGSGARQRLEGCGHIVRNIEVVRPGWTAAQREQRVSGRRDAGASVRRTPPAMPW